MSRINSNVSSLVAQRIVGQQNNALTRSLERLSTGLRINRGSDGPADLIASENLRAEKVRISEALGNAERASQIANIAEGGLQEISALLTEVQSLVSQTANDSGLSLEEKEANQQQIDSILAAIDQIAGATSFQGTKLLNGNYDFNVTSVAATVDDYQVNGAKIAEGGTVAVKAIVTVSAQRAGMFLSAGAAALNLTNGTSSFTFELAGANGAREFSFASGTALTDVRDSINNFKSITGVSAAVSGTGVVLKTAEFGSDAFVSIDIVNDGGQAGEVMKLSSTNEARASTLAGNRTAYSVASAVIRDEGQDVTAIINGVTARGKGKTASVNTDALDVSITLTTAGAQAAATISAFTISGGGAKFNIGPTVDVGNQVRLGIGNVASRHLGDAATGFLDDLGSGKTANLIDGNLETADKVVSSAIAEVAGLRGRIGAFQKFTLGSAINALGVALENTTSAESVIRDTDFAEETANLTRAQILVQAANSALSIANAAPQNVLSLI